MSKRCFVSSKFTVFILDDDDINLMLLEEALQDDYFVITEKKVTSLDEN